MGAASTGTNLIHKNVQVITSIRLLFNYRM
jgi:hypothetical protein